MASLTFVARRPGPFASLIQVAQLGPFRLEPMAPVRTTDQYWDTEDGELLRKGLSLRVREQGARRQVTLRAIRDDAQVPVRVPAADVDVPPGQRVDRLDLPAGPLADAVEAITGADPLRAVLTLRQYRTPRIIFDGARTIALASFDVVAFDLDGRQVVSNEVELNTTESGTAADLDRLRPLMLNHDLVEEQLSKLERGILRLHRNPSKPLLLLPFERQRLERIAESGDALLGRRARVLLLDSRGFRADTVAAQTGLSMGRVRHWKQRFQNERLSLFADAGAELVGGADSVTLPNWGAIATTVDGNEPVEPTDVAAATDVSNPRGAVGDGEGAPPDEGRDSADPRDADDLDSLLSFFLPQETATPLLDRAMTAAEEDAAEAEAGPDPEDEEVWFDEPPTDTSVPAGTNTSKAELSTVRGGVAEGSAIVTELIDEVIEPEADGGEPDARIDDDCLVDDLVLEQIGLATEGVADAQIEEVPSSPRALRGWVSPEVVEMRPIRSDAEITQGAAPRAEPSPDGSPPRPRLTGDTPIIDAAIDALVYAVAAFEDAAGRFIGSPNVSNARRILLTAHRVRLTSESFEPYVPQRAARRLVKVLRPLVDAVEALLDADRTSSARSVSDGHVIEIKRKIVSDLLATGGQRAWGERVRRLLDRLASQSRNGLLVGDDFPLAPDDFVGQPGDVPMPVRLRHVLGSMLWTRFEAIRAFEDDMAGGIPAETAYHFAIAASGLHFVLGLAEHAAARSVREFARQLDAAEHRAAAYRHRLACGSENGPAAEDIDGPDDIAAIWKHVTSESARRELAEIVGSI